MLLRKTAWFWKSGLAVISFVLMFVFRGVAIHHRKKIQFRKQ